MIAVFASSGAASALTLVTILHAYATNAGMIKWSISMARDYKREWQLRKAYDRSPAQRARRASRMRARRSLLSKVGPEALKGKDVDHKNRNASDNSPGNLRITSQKSNRGWRKGKSGYG